MLPIQIIPGRIGWSRWGMCDERQLVIFEKIPLSVAENGIVIGT
jgi:hypothetical protein